MKDFQSNHLTTEQLAERWNLSSRTINNWRYKKLDGPKFLKIGRLVYYPIKEVEAYEKRTRSSTR
jgi:hypothetical protein